MENSGLDTLPAEVLHRIASFLPCSSICNLCFSSRRLYAACYDSIVFKHSAVKTIYEDRYTHLPEKEFSCLAHENHCDWRAIDALDEGFPSSQTTTEVDSEDEWYTVPEEHLDEDEEWDFDNWGPNVFQRRLMPHEEWLLSWPQAQVFNRLSASDSACIAHAVERAQTCFNVSSESLPRDLSPCWTKERWIECKRSPLCKAGKVWSMSMYVVTVTCIVPDTSLRLHQSMALHFLDNSSYS